MSKDATNEPHGPTRATLRVGTAGWSIPRINADAFPGDGTHLQRYSRVLSCVEINSSFYRPHATAVYRKWALQTPDDFRFSVKVPRVITHEQRLSECNDELEEFLRQVDGLGEKLGALLVQLPPSLAFDERSASAFFERLRAGHAGSVICEPRHPSWFTGTADQFLQEFRIGRAAADPAVVPAATAAAGYRGSSGSQTPGIAYFRLHGSPRMYWSDYSAAALARWNAAIRSDSDQGELWCIFDNTAAGAALRNALELVAIDTGTNP